VASTKQRIRRLVDQLESAYGSPRFIPRFEPLEELISCILSQHTADANSFPTFTRLRERFPEWEQIASLTHHELADVIRKAGLANQKAKSIIAVLKEIKNRFGDYTLEPLREMKMEDARKWLLSLPGVGPKTAAIVLCFSFGMPAIPVDTHVFRVSWRLGLIDKKIGESKAHGALEAAVPEDLAFRFHTALIQHGRQTCKAPKPNCEQCVVRRGCRFYRDHWPSSSKKVNISA